MTQRDQYSPRKIYVMFTFFSQIRYFLIKQLLGFPYEAQCTPFRKQSIQYNVEVPEIKPVTSQIIVKYVEHSADEPEIEVSLFISFAYLHNTESGTSGPYGEGYFI